MKTMIVVAFILLISITPVMGGVHKNDYSVPCSQLWDAVMDTIKNSGHYTLILADDKQMTASYHISGAIHSRDISVHLEPQGDGCQMQTSTAFSGLMQNDAGDFKSRVEQSLANLKAAPPTQTVTPTQAAPATPTAPATQTPPPPQTSGAAKVLGADK